MTDITKHKFFVPALSAVLALYYTLPFLFKISYWGGRDWDLFTTMAAVPVGSVLDFGQFPFWNPYVGGGNILFHHPEVAVLSPFFLLYLIFGAVVGLKLQVLLCYFIGFYGSIKLFERIGLSTTAAALSAVVYFGSVHFALHFAEGHIPFTHFCFLPWYLLMLLRSKESQKYLLGAAICLALMILGNGAAIPLLYTLSFSALLVVLIAVKTRTITMVKNLIISIVVAVGLAAVKFVPMVVYLLENRWEGNPEETTPFGALGSIFFGLKHSLYERNFFEQQWAWHEYGAYISPLVVLMAATALVLRWRRHWHWLALAAFFLLLGMGSFGWYSPWSLLASLPGFSSARCTGRAFQFVILAGAVLGGLGYDLWRDRLAGLSRHRWWRFILPLAAAVVVLTNLVLAWPIMSSAFKTPPERIERSEVFLHVVDQQSHAYRNYLANRGSLITPWLSAYHPSRGLVDAANQVHMEHLLSGRTDWLRRQYTPNVITYKFSAMEPGEMVISMGYDRGWEAADGRALIPNQGLISFKFRKRVEEVVLTYRPPGFIPGLIISIIFLVGTVVLATVVPSRRAKSNVDPLSG